MPQPEPDLALKWKIEAEFLAVSEDQMEKVAISQGQLDKCIGSNKYQICTRTWQRKWDNLLA